MQCEGPSCYVQSALTALFTPPIGPYMNAALHADTPDGHSDIVQLKRDLIALTNHLENPSAGGIFDATIIRDNTCLSTGFKDRFTENHQESAVSFIQCLLNALGILWREDVALFVSTELFQTGTNLAHKLNHGKMRRPIFMHANVDMIMKMRPATTIERLFLRVQNVTHLDDENLLKAADHDWNVINEIMVVLEAPMLVLVVERPPGVKLEVTAPPTLERLFLKAIIHYRGNGNAGHWSCSIAKTPAQSVDIARPKFALDQGTVFIYVLDE